MTPDTITVNARRVLVYPGTPGAPLVIGLHGRVSTPEELAASLPFHTLPEMPTYVLPYGSPVDDDYPWYHPLRWLTRLRPGLSWNAGRGVAGWAADQGVDDTAHVRAVIGAARAKYSTGPLLHVGASNGGQLAQEIVAFYGGACATVGATRVTAFDAHYQGRCLDVHGRRDWAIPIKGPITIDRVSLPTYDEGAATWGGRHLSLLHDGEHEVPSHIDGERTHARMWRWFMEG